MRIVDTIVLADLYDWKRFVEGIRRGYIGPYKEELRTQEGNVVRTYREGAVIMGRMVVENAAIGNSTRNNPRTFFVHSTDIEATRSIYVPTDEDVERWGEDGLDVRDEISKREI